MENVASNSSCPESTLLDASKGVTLTTPIIGRITLGHTVARGDKFLPVRDDHFTITTLFQDKVTREWEKHELQEKLAKANEKLTAIPVRIAYNDVNLNLQNKFSAFDSKSGRAQCVGNGLTARRVTEDGVKTIDCPRPEACEYGQRMRCKSFSRAYFRIDGQDDELGTFILRTTSYNSLDRLGSRLNQLSGLTNGKIAGMPMMLVLRRKTTTQSFREPVYFADLVTRPEMKILQAVAEATKYQKEIEEAGLNWVGLETALRAGLANSDFADEIEDANEWLSEEELLNAVEQQTQKSELRGLASLTSQLQAKAEQIEKPAALPAPQEKPVEGEPPAAAAEESAQQDLLQVA